MMRALWTAASGMKSQQLFVDSIANNLANVNTIGFKKGSIEFKSLYYETLKQSSINEQGVGTPVSLQVGHGVRAVANTKDFGQGNLETTNNPLDFSLEGNGFFMMEDMNGNTIYSKSGAFKVSLQEDASRLVTSDGYSVLNTDGEPIEFETNFMPELLTVNQLGELGYITPEGPVDLGIQVGLAQFRNPAGLDAIGGTYYKSTGASGVPLLEADDEGLPKTSLLQGTLESSNVQVVEEMVKMIIAQRAYELNSKAIQTSDDMLGIANGLKR